MKPTSLQTRERIRQSQEKALDDILLAHEKEGREFGFATFGGPILNEGDVLEPYEANADRCSWKDSTILTPLGCKSR